VRGDIGWGTDGVMSELERKKIGCGKGAEFETLGVAWDRGDGSFYIKPYGTQIIEGCRVSLVDSSVKAASDLYLVPKGVGEGSVQLRFINTSAGYEALRSLHERGELEPILESPSSPFMPLSAQLFGLKCSQSPLMLTYLRRTCLHRSNARTRSARPGPGA
jgi:hypothetical protein